MHRALLLILLLVVLLGVPPSSGQAPEGAPTASPGERNQPLQAPPLDSLISRALWLAPELPEARSAVQAARSRVLPAAALKDPTLDLGAQAMGLPPGKASSVTLGLAQELPFPGKRDARRAVAQAEVGMREAELAMRKADVVEKVRILYGDLYAIDRRGHVLATAAQLIDAAARAAATQLSVGRSDQEGLLRLKIQTARIRQQEAGLRAARAGAAAELNRLLGFPPDRPVGRIATLPEVELANRQALSAGLASAPELLTRRAETLAAGNRLEVARLESRPDFMLGAGGGINAVPEPVIMLRLILNLPLWRRTKQDKLSEAAEHDMRAAQAAQDESGSRLSADLTRLLAEWDWSRELVREYKATILPHSQSALEATLAAYAVGRGEFALVIEDLNILLDTGAELARAEADALATWARIERIGPRAVPNLEGDTP